MIDLKEKFNDIDSDLSYSIEILSGNISYTISNDTLKLSPDPDWYGNSEIAMNITDGEFTLSDGFDIRRAATERRIPCFTSIDTAKAAVASATQSSATLQVLPVRSYGAGDSIHDH